MSLEISKNTILNALRQVKPQESQETDVNTPIDMTSDNSRTRRARREAPQWDFSLGIREGNTRLITPESVATVSNASTSSGRSANIATAGDGRVGSSVQGRYRGDCYFLAEINAIRNTEDGQAILNNNIKKNNDGSYTVTLPGAVKVRQQYNREGKRCDVTGTYHITQEAVDKAIRNAGLTYAQGDVDVILLELAMESYRAEMVQTNRMNPGSGSNTITAESSVREAQNRNNDDFLASGNTIDAGYILTGKKSEVYASDRKRNNVQRYQAGQYGYITREEMNRQLATGGATEKSVPQISSYTRTESGFREMLDEYQGKEDQFALTCSVRVQRGSGATANDGNHALTVVRITDDVVYCANPWHPDQIEPIPRDDFEKMVFRFQAVRVNDNSEFIQNASSTVNGLLDNLVGRMQGVFPPGANIQNVSQNRISTVINAYNSNTNNRPNRTNDRPNNFPLNVNGLVRIFNNTSRASLTERERNDITRLFQNMSSNKAITDEDLAILDYFREKYSN